MIEILACLILPLTIFFTGLLTLSILPGKNYLNSLEVSGFSWFIGLAVIGYLLMYISLAKIPVPPTVLLIPLLIGLIVYFKRIRSVKMVLTQRINWEIFLGIIIVVLPVLAVFAVNMTKPLWGFDGFMIWSLKAKLLYHAGINPVWLVNDAYRHAQLDYPILIPLNEYFLTYMYRQYSEIIVSSVLSYSMAATTAIFFGFCLRYTDYLTTAFLTAIFTGNIYIMLLGISGYMDIIVMGCFTALLIIIYRILANEMYQLSWIAIILAACLIGIKNEGFILVTNVILASCLYLILAKKLNLKSIMILFLLFLLANLPNIPWFIKIKTFGLINNVINSEYFNLQTFLSQCDRLPEILTFFANSMIDIERFFIHGICFFIGTVYLGFNKQFLTITLFVSILLSYLLVQLLVFIIYPIDSHIILAASFDRMLSHVTGLLMIPIILCLEREQKNSHPSHTVDLVTEKVS